MKKIIPFAFFLMLSAQQTYSQENTPSPYFKGTNKKISIPQRLHAINEKETVLFFEKEKKVRACLVLNNKIIQPKAHSEEQKELEKKLIDAYKSSYEKEPKIRKRIYIKIKGVKYFMEIVFV